MNCAAGCSTTRWRSVSRLPTASSRGNVVAKAEYIGEYLQTHPDDAESRVSLEALRKAAPVPIPFEELDFNFGERWIPAAVYSRYASWLFDTDVSVRYNASADEYNIRASELSPRIYNQYAVRSETRLFNGVALMRHAIHNTTPNITKTVTDKDGKDIKVRDPKPRNWPTARLTRYVKASPTGLWSSRRSSRRSWRTCTTASSTASCAPSSTAATRPFQTLT